MNEEKDILGQSLRERLKDYQTPVNDDVWKKIMADLPSQKQPATLRLWPRIASVAAVALLFFLIGWLFSVSEKDGQMINSLAKSIEKRFTPDKPLETEIPPALFSQNQNTKKTQLNTNPVDKPKEEEQKREEEAIATTKEETNRTKENEILSEKQKQFIADGQPIDSHPYSIKKKKPDNNTSIALAMGNQITSLQNNSPSPYSPFSLRSTLDNNFSGNNPGVAEIKHKTPFVVSLLARKNISDRWALESGVTYTRLSSTETWSFSSRPATEEVLDLDYIGIPLKVVYSLYQNDRLNLYASAGGMVEKCVRGEVTSSLHQEKQKVSINNPQWSVSGNIGINYRLIDILGLFVEPGLAYYFDDGNSTKTIRKDRPLNLNLQAGVRLIW